MTGSIVAKDGRKNYYAVLNIYDDSGRRTRKWIDTGVPVKGNNKRRADARLKEILAENSDSPVDYSKDALFTDYLTQWLDTIKISISPTTHDGYAKVLRTHVIPYFEPKKLRVSEITPGHIQKYINKKLEHLSPNTVIKHLANISKCLDGAVKRSIIAFNPVKRIEAPPQKVKFAGAKHYNENQILQLIECSKGDPLEIVIKLTLFYGLRRSEVLGLKWNAIKLDTDNPNERTLAIQHTVVTVDKVTHRLDRTKNASSRSVFPVTDEIYLDLVTWRDKQAHWKALQPNDMIDEGYICTHADGRLMTTSYVSHHFALLLRKSGMPHIRFHDLRHSSACYLKYLGFDLKDIQCWLRHKDIQTTMNLYVDLDMEAKRNIAAKLNANLKAAN